MYAKEDLVAGLVLLGEEFGEVLVAVGTVARFKERIFAIDLRISVDSILPAACIESHAAKNSVTGFLA